MNSLETDARRLLEPDDSTAPGEPLRGMALQLRLWRYPRSGPQVSWCLILPARDFRSRPAVVREISWDRDADLKKSTRRQVPPPTIRVRDGEMDWSDLGPFIEATGGLPMAALGKDPSLPSAEGTSGLEGYRSLAHIRLEWAGRGPRGWGPTIAWVARFRKLLARTMAESREDR